MKITYDADEVRRAILADLHATMNIKEGVRIQIEMSARGVEVMLIPAELDTPLSKAAGKAGKVSERLGTVNLTPNPTTVAALEEAASGGGQTFPTVGALIQELNSPTEASPEEPPTNEVGNPVEDDATEPLEEAPKTASSLFRPQEPSQPAQEPVATEPASPAPEPRRPLFNVPLKG